nr:bifunctional phosphopantothenoylcysteine decarboxylase/phosphopantothenate--cysteine ligase CoaBC [Desulfobacterales bacterium]
MEDFFKGKDIVLGVCGGIAAYKIPELVRQLVKKGACVRVIMTKNAMHFISPLTLEALSGQPVCTDLFERSENPSIQHISLAKKADMVVIAPATANTIGKMAHGIADDALTTFLLAVKAPIVVCPSMNVWMYENAIVQENLKRLRSFGIHVMSPDTGPLACGTEGAGRLPSIEAIIDKIESLLQSPDLVGERVLVTAGPTREPIDPVRFCSNPSSGRMGFAIARAARQRGAEVTLVSGPTFLSDPPGIKVIHVETAEEMFTAVMSESEYATIVIKAAAVSDFSPVETCKHKIKKEGAHLVLHLKKTPDILKALGKKKERRILVGFAAETEDLISNAQTKLIDKNLDLIVANRIGRKDSGFVSETNRVTFIYRNGHLEKLPLMTKERVANIILDRVLEIKANRCLLS